MHKALAWIAMVAVTAVATAPGQGRPVPAKVGEKLADFEFPRFLNGDGRQRLSDFFGHVVLVDFWATY